MAEKIKFTCTCGKKLVADAAAAGKKARCTGCLRVVQIPGAAEAAMPGRDMASDLTPFDELPPLAGVSQPPTAGYGLARDNPFPPNSPPPVPPTARGNALPPGMPPLPPNAQSPLSPLAVSPSTPTSLPGAIQSIWDEEDAYRQQPPPTTPCPKCGAPMPADAQLCVTCGFSLRTGTVRTSQPAESEQWKRDTPQAWLGRALQRGYNKGSYITFRISIALVVIGIVAVVYGIKEKMLADASSDKPEVISLKKLIERGPDGNANVIVTDFQLCSNFVKAFKTVAGQATDDPWTKVWVPAIPRIGILGFIKDVPGNQIHAIIYSTHVGNQDDLHRVLSVSQLHGMVVNRITSLSSKEKEILQNRYTGIDFDRCIIIEEGRTPLNADVLSLAIGGGGMLFLGGAWMLGRRFFVD